MRLLPLLCVQDWLDMLSLPEHASLCRGEDLVQQHGQITEARIKILERTDGDCCLVDQGVLPSCLLCAGSPRKNSAAMSHLCLPPVSGVQVLEKSVWHEPSTPTYCIAEQKRSCDVELQMHEMMLCLQGNGKNVQILMDQHMLFSSQLLDIN